MKRLWKDYDQMNAKVITVKDNDDKPVCIFIGYEEDIKQYLINTWLHFGKSGWGIVKDENVSVTDIDDLPAYMKMFPDGVILGWNPIADNANLDFEMNW